MTSHETRERALAIRANAANLTCIAMEPIPNQMAIDAPMLTDDARAMDPVGFRFRVVALGSPGGVAEVIGGLTAL